MARQKNKIPTLTNLLRKSDIVSRMGGDAETIAQKIMETFQDPFAFDDHKFTITPSIGIALYPDDGKKVDILLINADIAMYQAKEKGPNNYQRYTATMRAGLQQKRSRKNRGD